MGAVRLCRTCGQEKDVQEFGTNRHANGKRYIKYQCKACNYLRVQSNPRRAEHAQRHILKKKYGLTMEQFQEMKRKQDEKCAICGGVQNDWERRKELCVDHDHTTGKVRGLLCNNCNRALGLLKDSPEWLERASEYLKSAS